MRRGANRDGDDGDARSGRRRHYRAESHDWYAEDDVVPYAVPLPPRIDEVQRPEDGTSRGHSRSSRSEDASQPTMPPPPPRLVRSSTDAYRRPADIIVYEEEHDTLDGWRHERQRVPGPEYRRPGRSREHRNPSPISIEGPEDDEDAEIEVVEELDAEQLKRRRRQDRRRRRHSSRDDYLGSSESRRRRKSQKIPRPSSEDEEVEVRYRHSSLERSSPVCRPGLRLEVSDSPKHEAPRVSSIIENSRPPVASRRSQKVYENREVHHEDKPRRSNTVTTRHSRSSSRRPPSILGSIFGGSSSRVASPDRPPKYYECLVCLDEVSSAKCAKLKCGHRRCHSCLKRQFKLSITDPQQMPPKCCTTEPIPVRHVDALFDRSFKKTWNRKFAEYSTRNRTYCPSRRCGEWIKPANIQRDRESGRKMAKCERCKTRVCVACNGKWHHSRDCPKDEETARFLEQAKSEGWKRCYRCEAVVELKEGCNHMTCRCGAEFCMICGAKWKNCDCPWFSYESTDTDRLEMNVPIAVAREDRREVYADHPPSPGKIPRYTGPRPRPRIYDEEAHFQRLQEQRDEEIARRMQLYGDDVEYDAMGGVGDVIGLGNAAEHFVNDHYRRGGRNGPPQPGPPGSDRTNSGQGYVIGITRARGLRGGSMERRLADRLSESRQVPGSKPGTGMEPPTSSPPQPRLIPPMMPPPMGMPPPPGLPPMFDNGMFGMRAAERVIVERDPNYYDDEDSPHSRSSRSRRHHRQKESETTKSSTLAGLSGRGMGMGRVDAWRKFVEPGEPELEVAAASA